MTSPQGWDHARPGEGGPDPYGPGPYGTGPYGPGPGQPAGPPRNGFGIAALTLGLIGAVLFWTVIGGLLLGLLAVVFGILGFRRGRRGQATNGTMAMTGAIIGALALIASGVIVAVGASLLNSGEFSSLKDCLEHAGTQSEQKQCQRDFEDDFGN